MSTYTEQLFAGAVPTTWAAAYTAPATGAVILRDVEAYVGSSGVTVSLSIQNVSGSPLAFFVHTVSSSSLLPIQWQGRIRLNPGDEVWWNATAAGALALATGYVFSS